MLNAFNLGKSYGDRILFHGLTLNLDAGDRVALIGANGSGKSTLLDILNGDNSADSGRVVKKRAANIGYLKQFIYIMNISSTISIINYSLNLLHCKAKCI